MKYEYKKLEAETFGSDEHGRAYRTKYVEMKEIEELAAEGWRLISVSWDGYEIGVAILEREQKPDFNFPPTPLTMDDETAKRVIPRLTHP